MAALYTEGRDALMNDTQILTLAISIAVPLSLLIYGNSRITEAKETLRAELKAFRAELEARISLLESKMDHNFERIDQKLDTILKILADHEAKLPK